MIFLYNRGLVVHKVHPKVWYVGDHTCRVADRQRGVVHLETYIVLSLSTQYIWFGWFDGCRGLQDLKQTFRVNKLDSGAKLELT